MYYFILDKLVLPVTPSAIQFDYSGQNKTITLINDGEINILKDGKLEDISFSFLIPSRKYAFNTIPATTNSQKKFVDWMKRTKEKKKPFQFIIVRFKPNYVPNFYTNVKVSLESYNLQEDADNGFDIVATVKLKRYKPFGTKTLLVDGDKATLQNQRDSSTSPKPTTATEYKVKDGDSLWKIAKFNYGDGAKYLELAKSNGIINPDTLKAGETITLPKG